MISMAYDLSGNLGNTGCRTHTKTHKSVKIKVYKHNMFSTRIKVNYIIPYIPYFLVYIYIFDFIEYFDVFNEEAY